MSDAVWLMPVRQHSYHVWDPAPRQSLLLGANQGNHDQFGENASEASNCDFDAAQVDNG